MVNYTLFNKLEKNILTLPNSEIWQTSDLTEAKSMLSACNEYLEAVNLSHIKEHFIIISLDTYKEMV